MAYKQYEDKTKNSLFDVILQKYHWCYILLFFASLFLVGLLLDSEFYSESNLLHIPQTISIFLFIFAIFSFFFSFNPFFKSALLKIRDITWPSFFVIFKNMLSVIFFTGILIVIIYYLESYCLNNLFEIIKRGS